MDEKKLEKMKLDFQTCASKLHSIENMVKFASKFK